MPSDSPVVEVSRACWNGSAADFVSQLRHDVAEGAVGQQGRLPSERSLCELYGAPRAVVRAAVAQLEKEGVLYRLARAGTFLRPRGVRPKDAPARLRSITILMGAKSEMSPGFITIAHLAGYTEALDGLGIGLRFAVVPDVIPGLDSLLDAHIPREEQACVLDAVDTPALLDLLIENGVPFVLQAPYTPSRSVTERCLHVGINRAGGIFDAVKHLVEMGHRRIAYVGALDTPYGVPDTFEGYRAAMMALGVPWDPSLLLHLVTEEAGVAAAASAELLSRPGRPTAVVARCDGIALGVMDAAKARGLRVPEDLSVIGYNDSREASHSTPPLTTVAPPRRAAARAAIEMLLEGAAQDRRPSQDRILSCQLVVRASTAPPKA